MLNEKEKIALIYLFSNYILLLFIYLIKKSMRLDQILQLKMIKHMNKMKNYLSNHKIELKFDRGAC